MLEKVLKTAEFIRGKMKTQPKVGIVLGTGLGNLATQITDRTEIPYQEIPYFPVSTVEGHSGKLILGKLGGVDILAMQGRFHFYEGYDMKTVTYPIRVMHELGIKTLFLSNAAGGMNPNFEIGELMIINDHINMFPEHPLRGRNEEKWGPRFPDMHEVYTASLIKKAKQIAKENSFRGYHLVKQIEWQESDIMPSGQHHIFKPISNNQETPYCFSIMMERDEDKDDAWGAEFFVVTFLFGNSIDVYYWLFKKEYLKAPWLFLLNERYRSGIFERNIKSRYGSPPICII